MKIGRHAHVTVQYSLTTGRGVQVRDAGSRPIQYVHGCGALFARLEAALENRGTGDVVRVKLLPEDAFGRRDVDLVQEIARDALPPGEDIRVGNTLPLRNMPIGSTVHCIEMKPGKGAQLARSAGAGCQLVAREQGYATLRLRSGEMRKVPADCRATIGEVGNSEHNLRKLGKAGAKRWLGIRPTVRGVVMNPVDHPHGGGEGRTSGGRHPVTPWGVPTKGYKTRKNKRTTKFIVRRRK